MKNTESQLSRIKEHLLKGYGISHRYAEKTFGCARLAARIFTLKKTMSIEKEMVEYDGKRFARYTLNAIVL